MQKFKMLSVCWLILAFSLSLIFVQSAWSQTGDVNGDGNVTTSDIAYLVSYLYLNGSPPPNPINADVDGTAGINIGDLLQLTEYIFAGCSLEPYTGVGPIFSNIVFTLPRVLPDSGSIGVPFNLELRLSLNPGPDLMGIVIPFSYANEPGGVEVDLNSVDFTTGTIVPAGWVTTAYIDNVNDIALLSLRAGSPTGTPLTAGTMGLIARLNFTRIANDTGDVTCLSPAFFPPTHLPLLLTSFCADGTAPIYRVLTPRIGRPGDLNSDGRSTVSDIIFMINYLFKGGPHICGW